MSVLLKTLEQYKCDSIKGTGVLGSDSEMGSSEKLGMRLLEKTGKQKGLQFE